MSNSPLSILRVWADRGSYPAVALNRTVCVIGREVRGAHLPLHAPQVSKLHALIVRHGGRVYLRDLASTNGVERNGVRVLETPLADADVLRIGAYTLRCESGFSSVAGNEMQGLPARAALRTDDGGTFPFPPDRQTLLIGRRAGCDVRLDDPSVAPVHAVILHLGGRRHVRSLAEPGQTLLNGRAVHQSALSSGDELALGRTRLSYAEFATVDAAPVAASQVEVSLEDSQAPGTHDPGPGDSCLIEPALAAEASFHGEVVAYVQAVASPAPDLESAAIPPPTIAPWEDELVVPAPVERASWT